MGVLATYVRDKVWPEASMASGYAVDEALEFCTEYLAQYKYSSRRIWDANEELRDSGEVLQGAYKKVVLLASKVDNLHEYVLSHSVHTSELYQ
jgi:hypothetical protein